MKFIVNRAEFLSAISLAAAVINTRIPKPILANVLLWSDENSLCIYATDSDSSVSQKCQQVHWGRAGRTLVSCAPLLEIVRKTLDDTMTLEANKDSVSIRSSDAVFKLFVSDPDLFPPEPETEGKTFTMPLCDAQSVIGRADCALSKTGNMTYSAMNGMLLKTSKRKFEAVATDGKRLAISWCDLQEDMESAQAVVSPKGLALLAKLEAGKKPEESPLLSITFSDSRVFFECESVRISSTLVEGTFPPYEDVIPKECSSTATVDREAFMGAIRRAGLFVDNESKGLQFEFSKTGLHMNSTDPSSGSASVNFPCKYEGADIQIGFGQGYILDGLTAVKDEEVKLEMSSPARPGLIVADNYKYTIMPYNLKA